MVAPIAAASPASNPVRGSVFEDEAADVAELLVLEELDAVVEVPEDADSVVVELPLEPLADGVGVGVGVCGVLPVDVCEPPELCWPASGSVYWLSPADGPEAIAAAGTDSSIAARTDSQVSVIRQERTLRVLQPMRLLAGRMLDGAVLVVHSPPRGYVDEALGRHLGSVAILESIEARRPALVFCGHIWGREAMIGPT